MTCPNCGEIINRLPCPYCTYGSDDFIDDETLSRILKKEVKK